MGKVNDLTKKILTRIVFRIRFIIPDKQYLQIIYRLKMGKRLNLKNPQCFSEKIQWLKLYNRKSEYTQMVDKLAAKKYVSNIIGNEYIIPTIDIWEKVEEIDWEKLPDQFVLKTTHGGGSEGVIICKDKKNFNKSIAIQKLKCALKDDIYITFREWPYKNVKKRIFAEEFVECNPNSEDSDLKDYKFFCFNGVPKFCQVIGGRGNKMTIDFFDMNWNHQTFHEPKDFPFAEREPTRPACFCKMKELASSLSQNSPFIRVDFYEVNKTIKFGELTFFPTSGFGGFSPEIWDKKFGDLICLNQ